VVDPRPLAELADEELVTAHLKGRSGAFQDLYDRYRDRLIHFITRKTGDPDRAQDLVQEAFIRVTRHLHRFDTSKKFSTWIYTIASNLSKNELRNRSRSPLVLFQRLTSTWDEDHRPLQFEDLSMRPDVPTTSTGSAISGGWSRTPCRSFPNIIGWCSGCASWRGRATRRSARSPA
jgi:hypothetical protein